MLKNPTLDHDILTDQLVAFLADAEERGAVRADELDTLAAEQELGDEAVEALREALAAADVEIEPAETAVPVRELDLTPSAGGTTDSLQLFLNQIGKHALLTAGAQNTSPPRQPPTAGST
jgi:RNA polymerase primary sigma factor